MVEPSRRAEGDFDDARHRVCGRGRPEHEAIERLIDDVLSEELGDKLDEVAYMGPLPDVFRDGKHPAWQDPAFKELLAYDIGWSWRVGPKSKEKMPRETWEAAVNSPVPEVRCFALVFSSGLNVIPKDLVMLLADDPDPSVRHYVADNWMVYESELVDKLVPTDRFNEGDACRYNDKRHDREFQRKYMKMVVDRAPISGRIDWVSDLEDWI